jgi:hypothetical protein
LSTCLPSCFSVISYFLDSSGFNLRT